MRKFDDRSLLSKIYQTISVFLLSLGQSTILPVNFLLLFVLLKNSYGWGFVSGLVLDLLTGQRLGLSSLLFLLILGVFRLYSRKYEPRLAFLLPFVFLMSFFFAKIEKETWSFWQGLILCFCLLPLKEKFKKERQLKLDL